MPAAALPQLLSKVFLCITFHWDVWNLSYLQHVTEELARWPTHLEVRVVCNKQARLQETFRSWELPDTIQVVGSPANLSHPYELAWIHRDLMKDAYNTGEYTAFIYLEDDMRLTWKCIQSWAIDQEVLDPLGFQRQFFRTEIAPWNGREQLSDALQHVYLPTYGRVVDIGKQKLAHQHYIQLPDPYSAVFAASSSLMEKFMKSQYWSQRVGAWPAREMAANGIMFVDPPQKFWVAAVVPYFPDKEILAHIAAIQHLSNRYCGKRAHKQGFHDVAPPIKTTGFCVMNFEDFFIQDNTTENGPPHIDLDASAGASADDSSLFYGTGVSTDSGPVQPTSNLSNLRPQDDPRFKRTYPKLGMARSAADTGEKERPVQEATAFLAKPKRSLTGIRRRLENHS